jgi:hypothetical protein
MTQPPAGAPQLWWSYSPVIRCWAHMPLPTSMTWRRDGWLQLDQSELDDLETVGAPALCEVCLSLREALSYVFGAAGERRMPPAYLLKSEIGEYACRRHAPLVGTGRHFEEGWARVSATRIAQMRKLTGRVVECRICRRAWRNDAAEGRA